jgi:hypothetical protein
MRGCFSEFSYERFVRGSLAEIDPSPVSPLRGDPPSPIGGEGKKHHHNFVAARDSSFQSSPCFCQFIRM